MKSTLRILSILLLFCMGGLLMATDLNNEQQKLETLPGYWEGLLSFPGGELRLGFDIRFVDGNFSATMDSPDQAVYGLKVDHFEYENGNLVMRVSIAGIEYKGILDDKGIKGQFFQGGQSLPLDLIKKQEKTLAPVKPQEPQAPFPYATEDIYFSNVLADGNTIISLAGTYSYPLDRQNFPAVILISGSGPQDRNETLLGHKPFLVLADYLTRNGIAVLRYDDRGFAESEGDFEKANSLDFASDVRAAIAYLGNRRTAKPSSIGLIGHSEGGLIAPLVASEMEEVDFIVMLAGPGLPGDRILLLQQELIGRANGISEEELAKTKEVNSQIFSLVREIEDIDSLKAKLNESITELMNDNQDMIPEGSTLDEFVQSQVESIVNPWMLFFIKYDPAPALKNVDCPVLAVIGSKDLQVPPAENLQAIREALTAGGNKSFELRELPYHNHLFQVAETGSPDEYAKIEMTISPMLMEMVTDFIRGVMGD